MIQNCPSCGKSLPKPLNDGISCCSNCNRVVQSTVANRILSLAWEVRNGNTDFKKIKTMTKAKDEEIIMALAFVSDYGYSHDSLLKALANLGI